MTNLQKLIENGGWQPILEAPKDGTSFFALYKHGTIEKCMYVDGRLVQSCDESLALTERNLGYYMPLDTPERMAKVIEVLEDALDFMVDNVNNAEMASIQAKIALQKAEQIAGGEDA